MVASAGTQVTRAWKPPIRGLREIFHATFATHAYPRHTHDVWTVFIVDAGAIRYALDGRAHGAGQARVTVLPPRVVHDGRPATGAGFRKRVLYIETSLLGEHLIGPAVDRPIVADDALRTDVAALHDALGCAEDALEAETRFADVTDRIARALGGAAPERAPAPGPVLAEHLRSWFDAHLFEQVTIEAAAREIGATTTQVSRAFAAVFGITPHAYVIGRRLEAARDRILAGQALADVAAEVGFYDQAHLSRRFSRFLGTTPGRFRSGSPG